MVARGFCNEGLMTIHKRAAPLEWEALPRRGGAVTFPHLKKAPRSTAEDTSEKLAGTPPRACLRSHAGGWDVCEGKRGSVHLAHRRCHRGTGAPIRKPSVRGIDSGRYLFARLTLGPLFSSDRAARSPSAGPACAFTAVPRLLRSKGAKFKRPSLNATSPGKPRAG